jgi:phospholipid/cholesterol/gamma-HCH transport system substrate-binding protein
MKNNRRKILLGLFVVIGIAAFTFAIFYIGQNKNLFSSTITLSSVFKNVKGLVAGNNVRFAGIKVGSVSNITILNDTSIKVEVYIESSYQKFLRKDSKMNIGSDGLMGDKLVELTPGTAKSEMIQNNDVLVAVKPLDLDGIMTSAQNTLQHVEVLTDEVSKIAYKANHSNGIIHTLLDDKEASDRVKSILRNTDAATANLAQDLKAAQSNFLLKGFFKKKEKREQEEIEKKEKAKEEKEDKKK